MFILYRNGAVNLKILPKRGLKIVNTAIASPELMVKTCIRVRFSDFKISRKISNLYALMSSLPVLFSPALHCTTIPALHPILSSRIPTILCPYDPQHSAALALPEVGWTIWNIYQQKQLYSQPEPSMMCSSLSEFIKMMANSHVLISISNTNEVPWTPHCCNFR